MYRRITRLLSLMGLLSITGCPQPPADTSVDFVEFVSNEILNTSDTREPVDIDDIEFEFTEDEDAFNDVLDD